MMPRASSASGVVHLKGDVGDVEAMKAMVAELAAKHNGCLDFLVNNAGVMGKIPIEDMPKSEWDRFMDTNLTALFLTSQTFIRHCLKEKKGGRCVNVLSKSAVSTNSSGNVHYMASKGGGLMLTKGLANEMTKHGIYFNAILPGYVISHGTDYDKGTEEAERKRLMIPTQKYATPIEMGYVTAFLLSDKASQMAGSIVDCTGGLLL